MNKEAIAAFVEQMRQQHGNEIEGIYLPEGTHEYLSERVQARDIDTLTFMLKLSYLMGLQTGYAAQVMDGVMPPGTPSGPLQA